MYLRFNEHYCICFSVIGALLKVSVHYPVPTELESQTAGLGSLCILCLSNDSDKKTILEVPA